MTTMTVSRKQRLRELEKNIRDAAGQIQTKGLLIGRYLCEIRDDQLWEEEYDSWTAYLHEWAEVLVGKSFAQASKLIQAAEVSKRLPSDLTDEIGTSHLTELARLAPVKSAENPKIRDYSSLRKQDVARVLTHATKIAGGEQPTVQDLRKAVDHDLGIDRSAKAAETKERKNQGVDLRSYIDGKIGVMEAIRETLDKVPDDAWEQFNDENPRMVKRLATVCESLAAFLRKVQ